MRFKFLLLLFIGFLSTFFGEIKAEENFCIYTSTKEYDNCIKNSDLPRKPKWPLLIGEGRGRYWLRSFNNIGYQLKSNSGKELEILKGNRIIGFYVKESIIVPREKIMGWRLNKEFRNNIYMWDFTISYLDEDFIKKEINFSLLDDAWGFGGRLKGDVVSEFLSAITKMNVGEERNKDFVNNLIKNEIKNLIKKQEIITVLIKVQNSDVKNCIELNKVKFPELTERTKNIEQKIYSLRSKLDIPTYKKLKPICN